MTAANVSRIQAVKLPPGLFGEFWECPLDFDQVAALKVLVNAATAEGAIRPGRCNIEPDEYALVLRDVFGRMGAVLVFHPTEGNSAFVHFAYTVPHLRRRGCYLALWNALLVFAKGAGVKLIQSITAPENVAIARFSEKQGRQLIGQIYEYEVR